MEGDFHKDVCIYKITTMNKGLFAFFILACCVLGGGVRLEANNIRIIRDVEINPGMIINNIAVIDFAVEWDNSWRDDFNWDAAYIFLKYKKKSDNDWKHVLLKSEGHVLSSDYDWSVNTYTTTADYGTGVFIYRRANGKGRSSVDIKLKWLITRNGLTTADFSNGEVECAAMCMEVVYVPTGAYWLGDGISNKTFKTNSRPILPQYDLIRNDGTMKFYATGDINSADYKKYPPENAANRINESRNVIDNAWYATTASDSRWWVEFDTPKRVRYFGVSGVSGRTSYRPATWAFEGSKDGRSWTVLRSCTQEEWAIIASGNSYPVSNALKIDQGKVDSYKFYRIRTVSGTVRPMLSNVSMTEVDLDSMPINAYLMDKQSSVSLNQTTELCADDGDTWNSTLQANYPTGYEGFYAMKYEVSQDQYIRFLNKLQLRQQKMRTIGETLDNLQVGEYVYGTNRTLPSARNGIVLGARLNNQVVFASDLNSGDDPSQDGDGQTVACNFLSPADMLAYADWTGLRPLSEFEYEKMARRPFPYNARLGEWAWNSNELKDLKMPQSDMITDAGSRTESVANANVNAGNKLAGPVRVGAFAKGSTSQIAAGASFFGLMELSGNLAEIYYNANVTGRPFQGNRREAHGNGTITVETNASKPGDTDVSTTYWPVGPNAFTLRGGSFKSPQNQITISDRSFNTYFSDWNQKDSTATFRLGASYVNIYTPVVYSYLTMENKSAGKTNGTGLDSVCIGQTYTIKGSPLLKSMAPDVPMPVEGKCEYVWYVSNETGRNWQVIPDERGRDLTYSDFQNNSSTVRPLYFKRKTITPTYESETPYVIIRIINDGYEVNKLTDTIYPNNSTLGFWIETTAPADFTWKWKAGGYNTAPLKNTTKSKTFDYYFAEREHFNNIGNQVQYVQCDVRLLKGCVRKVDFQVYVMDRPAAAIITSEITLNGNDPRKECGVLMQDNRDGEIYGTVKIGNQCWMSENVRNSGISGAHFESIDPTGQKFGALYSWSASVRDNVCPIGWRVPTNADFNQLKSFLDADGYNLAGQKMKAGNYWALTSANKQYMGTNSSGFSAVSSGHCSSGHKVAVSYYFTYTGAIYSLSLGNGVFSYTGLNSGHWSAIRCIKR